MPPRRGNRNRGAERGDATPDIATLVSEQIMAALPNIINQVATGVNNARRNEETGGNSSNVQQCSYKNFMSCKPKEFKGTEGAVGLLHWIEGVETVLHISKCAEADKVEFATCQLKDRAQTWWKNQIQVRGREAANLMSWAEFVNLITEEYCPKDERQKLEVEFWNLTMEGSNIEKYTVRFHELARMVPHMVTPEDKRVDRYIWGLAPAIRGMVTSANPTTIQSAQVLANRLTNDLLRSGVFTKDKPDNKRKADTQQNKKTGGNNNNRNKRVRNFGMTASNVGTVPKCNKCNYHHSGDCPVCNKCKQPGHFARNCKRTDEKRNCCFGCGSTEHFLNNCPRSEDRKGPKQKVCFECGDPTHMRNRCPRLNRMGGGTGDQGGKQEAELS